MLKSSLVALIVLGSLGACASDGGPPATGRPFPTALTQHETLDVQVFLEPTTVRFTNTTARRFGPSTVWLNQRFEHPVLSIEPGETVVLRLSEFRDQWGDAFRGSGFFATDVPEKLFLTEIETTDENGDAVLYGLKTIGRTE